MRSTLELSEMLVVARANLWRAQERLGVKPDIVIKIPFGCGEFIFNMTSDNHLITGDGLRFTGEPRLECHMSEHLLRRILTRETHWNNAEVAFDIMFDRRPNTYMPDVHTLMSFFHV